MLAFRLGRYEARLAAGPADLDRAQVLRWSAFRVARGLAFAPGRDGDRFDALSRHILVEDRASGELVATFRILPTAPGAAVGNGYAAQFYDLSAFSRCARAKAEIGRFCLHPDRHDPDILRLAWAALARVVDTLGIDMLFGCSTFPGADPKRHSVALASLASAHIGPEERRPRPKALEIVAFIGAPGRHGAAGCAMPKAGAMAALPSLLRSYLALGGWVSDHAVIDRDLDTLHVFTALDIAAIPPARARALRSIAAAAALA